MPKSYFDVSDWPVDRVLIWTEFRLLEFTNQIARVEVHGDSAARATAHPLFAHWTLTCLVQRGLVDAKHVFGV
jgi:hypothetical protein